jgi:hypothetical protein
MSMLDRRVQLLLNQRQYGKVALEAKRRGTSVAAVIREAIEHLPDDASRRRAAGDAILAAEPMEVPEDPKTIRRERDAALDARW